MSVKQIIQFVARVLSRKPFWGWGGGGGGLGGTIYGVISREKGVGQGPPRYNKLIP